MSDDETSKAARDALIFGAGMMKDGKHVPMEDFYTSEKENAADDLVKRLNMVDATMHPMTLVIIAREAARRIYHLETEVRVTAGWDRAMQELADKQAQRIEQLEREKASWKGAYDGAVLALTERNKELEAALREPTLDMLIAGKKSLYSCSEDPELDDARKCFKAMVAALGEKKDD